MDNTTLKKEIKVGQIVKLKSGGPVMTITIIFSDNQSCTCSWFDNKQMIQSALLPIESLKIIETKQ